MNFLALLRQRFHTALSGLAPDANDLADLVSMVRPSQDVRFGDYQANSAMPLAKRLAKSPRDLASEICARLNVADVCQTPEVAGPGFINLKLRDDRLAEVLTALAGDPRLGVPAVEKPRTFVIDYSAPNVAKPMHVGHIRSTIIGDSLYRTLAFLGHRVIGDNHIGDWGTQFGMILFGWRHLRDEAAYAKDPVAELARLYRLVNRLVDYYDSLAELPQRRERLAAREAELVRLATQPAPDPKAAKELAKSRKRLQTGIEEAHGELAEQEAKIAAFQRDAVLADLARRHPTVAADVLAETAKLHAGDPENLRLWRQFLPACLEDINRIYRRLGVRFDHALGESFYHDRLAGVVRDLVARGIARETAGAVGVFTEGQTTPLLIRKQDGAFLYGTSDLATIQYRMETWSPDAILYVVDHRQSLHFQQLFAAARRWGYTDVELEHISFGTVLGEDGRPFKARSGETVGLEGVMDEAVDRALRIVSEKDDAKPDGPELSAEERRRIAPVVGIAAMKYADLSQNRTSDYVFSYDKMLATEGNTSTYMQYAYARVRSIFRKGAVDVAALRASGAAVSIAEPAERALGLAILRFPEALDAVAADYRPNHLTSYLWELANQYSTFYDQCPVLKAPTDDLRTSRLLLSDLTARVLAKGLELLGIDVLERM
jgi:arginyl-tRNA synthetase